MVSSLFFVEIEVQESNVICFKNPVKSKLNFQGLDINSVLLILPISLHLSQIRKRLRKVKIPVLVGIYKRTYPNFLWNRKAYIKCCEVAHKL